MRIGKKLSVVLILGMWVLQTRGDGKILSIKPEAANIKLTIRTVAGERYQIQYRVCLVEGRWANLGEKFVAKTTLTSKSLPASEMTFLLRVVQLEEPIGPAAAPGSPPPPPLLPND